VVCFFDMVGFDVRDIPDIRGILAQRITGELTLIRSLEMLLVGIFRGHANGIEVKSVVIGLRKPENGFMPSGEPPLTMQAVAKRPDDTVAKLQTVMLEKRIKNNVERENLAIIDMVADLPTNRAVGGKKADGFGDASR